MPHKNGISDEEFFLARVRFVGACWEWQGSLNRGGYGKLALNGTRQVLAHRFSYECTYGPMLPGQVAMHSCDNRRCVRASHLSPGSIGDNSRDMWQKGRGRPGNANRTKTHCKRGHEFTDRNTWRSKRGGRFCRACANAYQKARNHRLRDVAA